MAIPVARRRPALAVGLVTIGFGVATVAVLGPLASGLIEYRITETLRNQTIGLDAVALFAVAPLSILASVLVLRGHVAGPALALGIGAYVTYMAVQYVVGPEYERLPGNNELLFPLHLLLLTTGWLVVLTAWNALGSDALRRSKSDDNRTGKVVLPILAFLAFIRYLPALADWMSGSPQDRGYLAGPTFAWAIALLDLGVFFPVTVAACIGLVRRTPWAHKVLFAVVGWFALVGLAVAAMALTMYANGDPVSTGTDAAIMTLLGGVFAALAATVFAPLFRRDHG